MTSSTPKTALHPSSPHVCPTCGDEFSRADHLTRHIRSTHDQVRRFACPTCRKSFARSDVFARHFRSHAAEEQTEARIRSNTDRIPRACANCARSKVRCDQSQPCNYCVSRELHCYRTPKAGRRRTADSSRTSSRFSPSDSNRNVLLSSRQQPTAIAPETSLIPKSHPFITDSLENLKEEVPQSVDAATEVRQELPTSIESSTYTKVSYPTDEATPNFTFEPGTDKCYPNLSESALFDRPTSIGIAQGQSLGEEYNYSTSSGSQFADLQLGWDLNIPHWMPLDFTDSLFDVNLTGMSDSVSPNNFSLSSGNDAASADQPTTFWHSIKSKNADAGTESPKCLAPATKKPNPLSGAYVHVDDVPKDFFHKTVQSIDGSATQVEVTAEQEYVFLPKLPSPAFPKLSRQDLETLEAECSCQVEEISQDLYNRVLDFVTQMTTTKGVHGKLNVWAFPERRALNCFVQLYFLRFQPIFPVIHQATFVSDESHWIMLLAVATIGCRFSRIECSRQLVHAMSELLGISLFDLVQMEGRSVRTLWLTMAMLLDQIGMMYGGSRKLLEVALALGNTVTTMVRRNNYLRQSVSRVEVEESTSGENLHSMWTTWTREESRRRAGYGCWIIQCQLPLNFEIPGSMRLSEMNAALPCPDELWEARTAQEWKLHFLRAKNVSLEAPTIKSALRDLVQDQKPRNNVGNFGRLVLVHAIYATAFEMRASLQNPLCSGLDFGASRLRDGTYFSWQKRMVELLEVLQPKPVTMEQISPAYDRILTSRQQMVNIISTAAQHVSLRIYAPIGDFLLYSSIADEGPEKLEMEHRLFVWSADDRGRTARRAVLHACALFTNIRTNSSSGFHEPIAFLVATLTVWIYNHLVRGPGNQVTVSLDNISDPRAAQLWLEGGPHAVSGYLTDVGSINQPGAGRALLEVARQSLLQMSAWGLSQGFAAFVDSLQRRTR